MRTIQTIDDVKAYIFHLAETGRIYHWDDSPSNIVWSDGPLPDAELAEMDRCHDAVWSVCDPWELMDLDPAIDRIYFPEVADDDERSNGPRR